MAAPRDTADRRHGSSGRAGAAACPRLQRRARAETKQGAARWGGGGGVRVLSLGHGLAVPWGSCRPPWSPDGRHGDDLPRWPRPMHATGQGRNRGRRFGGDLGRGLNPVGVGLVGLGAGPVGEGVGRLVCFLFFFYFLFCYLLFVFISAHGHFCKIWDVSHNYCYVIGYCHKRVGHI